MSWLGSDDSDLLGTESGVVTILSGHSPHLGKAQTRNLSRALS